VPKELPPPSIQAAHGKLFMVQKTYPHSLGLSCSFRQWRANTHCRYLHGYAMQVRLSFASADLDTRNWVLNFGGLKEIKQMIIDLLDHRTLVANDDPDMNAFLAAESAALCV
jgi:6-pyruvoyltetrahydropterin/6-carboxytetrahydropterin synthase